MNHDEPSRVVSNLLRVEVQTPLWRVFPVSRLLEVCTTNELALVSPSRWEDPYENFLSQCTVAIGTEVGSLASLTRGAVGQCWTRQETESDATWRIYAPREERGIRVRVTAIDLLKTIWDENPLDANLSCFLGAVNYWPTDQIHDWVKNLKVGDALLESSGKAIAETLLVKRNEFAHENEVRLLHFKHGVDEARETVRRFPCDPNSLIMEMMLDPRLSRTEADSLTKLIRCAGYQGKLNHSALYRAPSFGPSSL